jgi:hypothetical protein
VTARLWRRRTPPGRSRLGKRVCQSTSRLLHEIVVRGDRSRRGPRQSGAGPRLNQRGAAGALAGIPCPSRTPVDAPVTRAIASRSSPAPAWCSDPFANPRMCLSFTPDPTLMRLLLTQTSSLRRWSLRASPSGLPRNGIVGWSTPGHRASGVSSRQSECAWSRCV